MKWKKPLLKLVVDQPPPTTTTPTSSQEPSDSGEANDTKLKLPRSIRSTKGSNMLRERNAEQSGGESEVGNGGFVQSSSSGPSGSRTSDEKENHTRRI